MISWDISSSTFHAAETCLVLCNYLALHVDEATYRQIVVQQVKECMARMGKVRELRLHTDTPSVIVNRLQCGMGLIDDIGGGYIGVWKL